MSPRRTDPASEPAAEQAFDAAAAELYGLEPAAFVAARDARSQSLRAGGDVRAAKAVKALKKPSAAAWALNLLVREDRVQVDALLALGGELRDAQTALDGDDLRALSSQRHRLVRAVAGRAADLARAAGHPLSAAVTERVSRSLDAALSDPDAAAALVEARLVTDLSYAGLGETGASVGFPALTVVRDGGSDPEESGERSARAKAARRSAIAAAERAFAEAATGLESAEENLARAKDAADAANLRVASAADTLAAARAEVEASEAAEQVAERALVLADKAYDRASTRHVDAQARLDDLHR